MTLSFGSLFSGIGGFDLGFERAGMVCLWQCEIDPKAREVLSRHFDKPIIEDVKNVRRNTIEPVDIICGGFPCQDLSVAGKRAGLAGKRSGLWFEFARVIDEFEPRYVIIENVPGLLSSNRGSDFAVIIQWLVQRGYGVAWRVLDAQYFGVAQRRRRVFIVASFGNGSCAEILFEREGMPGYPPTRNKAEKDVTEIVGTLAASGGGMDRPAGNANELDFCVAIPTIAKAIRTQSGGIDREDSHTLIAAPILARQAKGPFTDPVNDNIICSPLAGVRRLTPTECARLQGFPDDWNGWLPDSARYRQFGNAVCVPVAEWIARRIAKTS